MLGWTFHSWWWGGGCAWRTRSLCEWGWVAKSGWCHGTSPILGLVRLVHRAWPCLSSFATSNWQGHFPNSWSRVMRLVSGNDSFWEVGGMSSWPWVEAFLDFEPLYIFYTHTHTRCNINNYTFTMDKNGGGGGGLKEVSIWHWPKNSLIIWYPPIINTWVVL